MSIRSKPGVETRPNVKESRTKNSIFHTTTHSSGLQSRVSERQAFWPEASLRSMRRAEPGSLPAQGLSTASRRSNAAGQVAPGCPIVRPVGSHSVDEGVQPSERPRLGRRCCRSVLSTDTSLSCSILLCPTLTCGSRLAHV